MSVGEFGKTFDPSEYWEERLGKSWGLESVGYRGLSLSFNEWMYRVRRHRFLQQLAVIHLDASGCDVLDIGSGTGFYVDIWRELRARSVIGSDLAQAAVANLQASRADVSFFPLDIGVALPDGLKPESFDVISAFDLFFHIVDDARFQRALSNIAVLLRPGGTLLFSDTLLTHELRKAQPPHVKWRRLDVVQRMLAERGFTILDQRPVFVLMNEPTDSPSRTAHLLWSAISKTASRSERVGNWVGQTLFPVEIRLLNHAALGRGVRMFACRWAG